MDGIPQFRLQNTNSGLLLGSIDYWGYQDPPLWGLVCQGSLTHPFNLTFAHLLCKNLGFESAEFIGLKEDFRQNSTEIPINGTCDLQFIMSGANCDGATDSEECRIYDFRTHGGACIHGKSEVYVSCVTESIAFFGKWSEWSEPTNCEDEAEFIQRTRECKTFSSSPGSCEGPWLKFESCPSCIAPEIHDNYNVDYYSSPESDLYYDYDPSYYFESTEPPKMRPKRSSDGCFCNFTTEGYIQTSDSYSGPLSGIVVAALGVVLLAGGFAYHKKKQKKEKTNESESEITEKKTLVDEKTAETRNELLSA